MIDWSETRVGDVVIGARDGKAWEITEKFPDGRIRVARDERSHVFVPSGQVERIQSADEALASAEAVLKLTMPGAMTLGTLDVDSKLWVCPYTYPELGPLLAHIHVLHRKSADDDSILETLRLHYEWHQKSDLGIPHVHSRDFIKERTKA